MKSSNYKGHTMEARYTPDGAENYTTYNYFNVPIKVQLLNEKARIPTKAHQDDAGWDLYSIEDVEILPGERKIIKTGISLQIPNGYAGLIWPRSGLSVKNGIDVLAGVVDATYRGEVMVCLLNTGKDSISLPSNSRIAQILFQEVPRFVLTQTSSLDDTNRGTGGFGSSGA